MGMMNKSSVFILCIVILISISCGCSGKTSKPVASPVDGTSKPSLPMMADNEGILVLNTSSVFFQPNENVDIGLVLWDKNKNLIDADVSLKVIDPDGNMRLIKAVKADNEYKVSFTPKNIGTYFLAGVVNKPGYKILYDSLYIVVGQMSRLKINYSVDEKFDIVTVNVYANGALTSCDANITQDGVTESRYVSDGKIYLFNCTSASIYVDKMMFEPAVLDYVK
jgi:hypothetical protein